VVLDTNIYVDWLNEKVHESVVLSPGYVRYLSAIVLMELRVGATNARAVRAVDQLTRAYRASKRLVTPSAAAFEDAGRALRTLRSQGVEIRRSSIVNDVLIAQSARALGASVVTRDRDYEALGKLLDVDVRVIVS
jgi:predicted nucleic acid-binding protein